MCLTTLVQNTIIITLKTIIITLNIFKNKRCINTIIVTLKYRILECKLPKREKDNMEEYNEECDICYNYKLEGAIPNRPCDNKQCGKVAQTHTHTHTHSLSLSLSLFLSLSLSLTGHVIIHIIDRFLFIFFFLIHLLIRERSFK